MSGDRFQYKGTVQSYRDLDVWKKSIQLVKACYEATKSFPKEEMFGLTSQIRRSAVSVPANIAEGRHRNTAKEILNFLKIAYGSLAELETHLIIALELNYISEAQQNTVLTQTAEIGRMINGLRKALIADTRHLKPETLEGAL